MKPALIPVLTAVLLLTAPAAQALTFKDHGQANPEVLDDSLQMLIPVETVKVHEPHEEADIEFKALPLAKVLDKGFGPDWRKHPDTDIALFVCADGYRAPVPLARIKQHKAWLAHLRTDRPEFAIDEKQPQPRKIDLNPFFLIWDTLNDPDSKAKGKEGWPYQIVGIELTGLEAKFPKLVPPAKASAAAHRGFTLFARYCVSCHALGGEGGKVGPELNSPISVTTYYKEEWLKKWIANPSSIRAGTIMPAVVPAQPAPGRTQAQAIDDIVAYLKSKAPKK
jgi:cytochrome c2